MRKSVQEPWPWSKWLAAENWSALVDDQGFGIGAWHPGVLEFHGGFAGARGKGGPKDAPTGYFAPMRTDILDANIVYDYECVFVVGTLAEIRDYTLDLAALPAYGGALGGLAIDLPESAAGDRATIAEIRLER